MLVDRGSEAECCRQTDGDPLSFLGTAGPIANPRRTRAYAALVVSRIEHAAAHGQAIDLPGSRPDVVMSAPTRKVSPARNGEPKSRDLERMRSRFRNVR